MVGGRGGRRERRGETGNVKLVVEHLVVEHLFWVWGVVTVDVCITRHCLLYKC